MKEDFAFDDSYAYIDSDQLLPDDNDNVIVNCGDFGIDIDAVDNDQVELRYIDISGCVTGIDLFGADPDVCQPLTFFITPCFLIKFS